MALPVALAYAGFVVWFPWESITRVPFSDFHDYVYNINYFHVFENVPMAQIYRISTVREYLVNEILWHEIVRWLTNQSGEAAISLRILSFFILFVWAMFLLRRLHYGIAFLFLFNPTALDVALSGIRNGLAWALFLIALTLHQRLPRVLLFVSAAFIHSTTLALLAIYGATSVARPLMRPRTLLVAGIGVGAFIGLALTVGNTLVLGALGDRRVGAAYVVGGGSLLQASIWIILLVLQCLSGRDYIRRNILVISVLAWYVTMNVFIPWSFRIWGAFLPMIAISAMELSPRKRRGFLYAYSGYLMLQYLYWTKLLLYFVPG